jgi:hypothetical protein
MTWWHQLYPLLDLVFITPYRTFANPVAGFYFGTFVLCIWCVILGEITFRVASGFNREYLQSLRNAMTRMHNLSVKALILKDKENFQACNKEANEAFGKYFFNMLTLGAAVLWPIPFALAWMGTRFGAIEFELFFSVPFFGNTIGFPAIFIPLYILVRIVWAKVKRLFSVFIVKPEIDSQSKGLEEMISMKEVDQCGGIPERFWHRQQH